MDIDTLTIFWVAHCDDPLLLRPEAATVGCCRRQQHLWSHRNPYLRPEAAIFSCGRRPQDFLCHMSRQKLGHMVTIMIRYARPKVNWPYIRSYLLACVNLLFNQYFSSNGSFHIFHLWRVNQLIIWIYRYVLNKMFRSLMGN